MTDEERARAIREFEASARGCADVDELLGQGVTAALQMAAAINCMRSALRNNNESHALIASMRFHEYATNLGAAMNGAMHLLRHGTSATAPTQQEGGLPN